MAKKKRYFEGQKLRFGKDCIGLVSISIQPLIKGRSFDHYIYHTEAGTKLALKNERLRRKGLKVCDCGCIIS